MKKTSLLSLIICATQSLHAQYFDRNYTLANVNCCTVQSVSGSFSGFDQHDNIYSHSVVMATSGNYYSGSFSCHKPGTGGWAIGGYNALNTSLGAARADANKNTIVEGTTTVPFYVDNSQTILAPLGNFYVKYDSTGVAQWVIPRKGALHIVDNAGSFISVTNDSTFKYDASGNFLWAKPIGTKGIAISSYDLNYYYYSDTSSLTKLDTTGNVIWSQPYNGNYLRLVDRYENLYFWNSTGMIKEDSAGNFITSKTFLPQAGVYRIFDSEGNIYEKNNNTITRYDSSGVNALWSYTNPGYIQLTGVLIDRSLRVYLTYDYNSFNNGLNSIFIPPSYYSPGTGNGQNRQLSIFGTRIIQDSLALAPDSIITGTVSANYRQNICTGNSFQVTFTVTKYPVMPLLNPLFNAELSDSTGSFLSPLIIGQSNYSPVNCVIPDTVLAGNNYRIRIVLADNSIIGTSNTLALHVRPAPVSAISNVSGYGLFNPPRSYNSCIGSTVTLTAATNINYTYQWQTVYFYSPFSLPIYTAITNQADSLWQVTSNDNRAVKTTDTSTGCWKYSDWVYTWFSTPQFTNIHLSGYQPYVCSNALPLSFSTNYTNTVYSGAGINNNSFLPDSAGNGIHLISCSVTDSYCGMRDTSFFINVNAAPVLSLTGLADTACINYSPYLLSVLPSGGILTGTAISGNYFDPSQANIGSNTISYQFLDTSGCSDLISKIIWVDVCASLSEYSQSLLSVSPNPVNDYLFIRGLNPTGQQYQVTDLLGRVFMKGQFNTQGVNLRKLDKGIYFLRLLSNDKLQTILKFAKQ